jgi:hypothetical protein
MNSQALHYTTRSSRRESTVKKPLYIPFDELSMIVPRWSYISPKHHLSIRNVALGCPFDRSFPSIVLSERGSREILATSVRYFWIAPADRRTSQSKVEKSYETMRSSPVSVLCDYNFVPTVNRLADRSHGSFLVPGSHSLVSADLM